MNVITQSTLSFLTELRSDKPNFLS